MKNLSSLIDPPTITIFNSSQPPRMEIPTNEPFHFPLTRVGEENPSEDVCVFNMSQIENCQVVVSEIRRAISDSLLSNVLNFTK